MGIKEEVQAKGIKNIFNKTITEDFLNLEKEMPFKYRRLLGVQTDKTRKELPTAYYS
jgi:hypothetical protein